MPTCDPKIARGLARDHLRALAAGHKPTFDTLHHARDALVCARSADLARKMRARDFRAFAHTLQRERARPGVLRCALTETARKQVVRAAFVRPFDGVLRAAETRETRFAIDTYGLHHARFASDGRRYHDDFWISPVSVMHHAVKRFIERSGGERTTPADVARLIAEADTWGLLYLRAHTLPRDHDLPCTVVAPVAGGVLVGEFWTQGHYSMPTHSWRTQYEMGSNQDDRLETVLAVRWQTFLSDALLYPTQRRTLDTLRPALTAAHQALTRDPDVAAGMPRPDALPRAELDAARDALARLVRQLHDHGLPGFAKPDETRLPSALRDAPASRRIRATLWPAEATGTASLPASFEELQAMMA